MECPITIREWKSLAVRNPSSKITGTNTVSADAETEALLAQAESIKDNADAILAQADALVSV